MAGIFQRTLIGLCQAAAIWHTARRCVDVSTPWYSSCSAPASPAACAFDLPKPGGRSLFQPRSTGGNHAAHRSPSAHQEPRAGVRRGRLRAARRLHPARLRPAAGVDDPPHPRPPRAGRRAHGRGLRPRHRPPRRRPRDVGPGGHQPRHAADGRLHGLHPDGRHHRPGAHPRHRQRRLPGVRHRRHHPLGDEAQRAGDDPGGDPAGDPPGVPPGVDGPARTGARRRPQGRAAEADGVVVAERRRGRRVAARATGRPRRATRG